MNITKTRIKIATAAALVFAFSAGLPVKSGAELVSCLSPVGGHTITIQMWDEADNIVTGKVKTDICWELGSEKSPKFTSWDDSATFTVELDDGSLMQIPNREVKRRFKEVYGTFAPAGMLRGDVTKPHRRSAGTASKSDNVLVVQKKLKELGYAPGVPDGIWGQKTEAAVQQYQQDKHLPTTGRLDAETLKRLGLK